MSNQNEHKPGYKHTPLGWIPEEWEVREFGEIVTSSQYGLSNVSANGGKHKIIGMKNIQGGKLVTENCATVSLSDKEFEKYKLITGDFLFNRTNSYDLVGKSVLIETDPNATFASYLIRFKLDKEKVVPKFVCYFFNTDKADKKLKAIATKAVSQANINPTVLQSVFEILIPTLPEQRKIAAILSTWDEAITKTLQLIAQLQQRNKGLMQQLLTGKKRLKGFDGKEWKKLHATDIFKSVSVKNNGTERLLSATQGRGIIPRDMLEARVTMPAGETGSFKLVEIGDFVISLRSFQGGIEYSEYKGLVSPAYTVLKPTKPINTSFFKHYFKSYDFIGHLAVAVIGIRDGKQVSYEDFSILKLPYPDVEEQEAIAKVLDAAINEVKLHEHKFGALQQQKKGLMQKLLTGEVRVKI